MSAPRDEAGAAPGAGSGAEATPEAEAPWIAELRERRRVWAEKPSLRMCYAKWVRMIRARARPGTTLEVAAGSGVVRDLWNDPSVFASAKGEDESLLLATDLLPTPWIDRTMDALALDVPDGSIDNVLGVDAFHHFNEPTRFLDEALRALRPGGRLILLEPWISPASFVGYRLLHHEDVCFTADKRPGSDESDPWNGNLAMMNRFWKRRAEYLASRPAWRVAEFRRFGLFDFQLAGGFKPWALVPWPGAYAAFLKLDDLLAPLMPLLAFRALLVLEKAPR